MSCTAVTFLHKFLHTVTRYCMLTTSREVRKVRLPLSARKTNTKYTFAPCTKTFLLNSPFFKVAQFSNFK